MRLCDPTINFIGQHSVCYTGLEWIPAVIGAVGAIAGATTSIISGQQQSAALQAQAQAQAQEAENARAIAEYNAEIQRQNNEVAYQMALYQADYGAQMAAVNQAYALNNAALVEAQSIAAGYAYEQGIQDAKQKELDAEAARLTAIEEADRQREENDRQTAILRSKYAASGVTMEGSPLVVLADTVRLGESIAQDIRYSGELESQKMLREGEIAEFEAGFSLLDQQGFSIEAQNLKNQAAMFGYESELYEYDSVIAGVQKGIDDKYATLIELGGEEKAYSLEAASQQSSMAADAALFKGYGTAATSLLSGASTSWGNYYTAKGKTTSSTGAYQPL